MVSISGSDTMCESAIHLWFYIDVLEQNCSNIANALELLQSCTKPSICSFLKKLQFLT